MPEIEIRPAVATDIPALIELDHNYMTDFVWQMDLQQQEENQLLIGFREIRLPRSVRVEYPRSPRSLLVDWTERDGLLVGFLGEDAVGYASVSLQVAPMTTWVTDLAVKRRQRRQGIGSALLLAAQEWGLAHESRNLVLEVQPKNHPALRMAQKLGFEFCGYNDRYFANRDIGLFFAKSLR
jgi:ribosomal protein S18 acetylase RimI-like enzyme